MSERVAVFVDGDNISSNHAVEIHAHAKSLGKVDILRVYANTQSLGQWTADSGYQCIFSGDGKNASDLLLSIDAMDLSFRHPFDIALIISSDGDFSHLAHRLRESGITVVGRGEHKTPDKFQNACTEFIPLTAQDTGEEKAQSVETNPSAFDHTIKKAIAANSVNGSGILITALAPIMHQQHGTMISQKPEKTWRAYLSQRPRLYDLDAPGRQAKVRFKPAGFQSSPPCSSQN